MEKEKKKNNCNWIQVDPRCRSILSWRNDWMKQWHKFGFIWRTISKITNKYEGLLQTFLCARRTWASLAWPSLRMYDYWWIGWMSTLSMLQHAVFACKHTQEAIFTSSVPKYLLFLLELHFESYIDNKARLLWALNYMPKSHWYLYCQLTSQDLFISSCLSLQVIAWV